MNYKSEDLKVIIKAKELCNYVITITQKSPKNFRYTFINRMQNYCLDIIENLYKANDMYVLDKNINNINLRLSYQKQAMTSLKLLVYVSMLAMENKCILLRQYENISKLVSECINYLGGWIKSDKKRLQG